MTTTIDDPWHERPCETCAKPFVPRAHGRKDAAKAVCCSPRCSALKSHRTLSGRAGRTKGSYVRALTGVDLVPCTRCSLRGHEAGDPDRCLQPLASTGLGGQSWL